MNLPTTVAELRKLASSLNIKWTNAHGKNKHLKKDELITAITNAQKLIVPTELPPIPTSIISDTEINDLIVSIPNLPEVEIESVQDLKLKDLDWLYPLQNLRAELDSERIYLDNKDESPTSFSYSNINDKFNIEITLLVKQHLKLPYYFNEYMLHKYYIKAKVNAEHPEVVDDLYRAVYDCVINDKKPSILLLADLAPLRFCDDLADKAVKLTNSSRLYKITWAFPSSGLLFKQPLRSQYEVIVEEVGNPDNWDIVNLGNVILFDEANERTINTIPSLTEAFN